MILCTYVSWLRDYDSSSFCAEATSWAPESTLPFVGFDAESQPMPHRSGSHVVLIQICLSPNYVVLLAIHQIVRENGHRFPEELLEVLSRWFSPSCVCVVHIVYLSVV